MPLPESSPMVNRHDDRPVSIWQPGVSDMPAVMARSFECRCTCILWVRAITWFGFSIAMDVAMAGAEQAFSGLVRASVRDIGCILMPALWACRFGTPWWPSHLSSRDGSCARLAVDR